MFDANKAEPTTNQPMLRFAKKYSDVFDFFLERSNPTDIIIIRYMTTTKKSIPLNMC
jgi:hypothetical protein